jgi:dTDP-4-amino-4,6-dideoxygalactose transaminase
MAHSVPGGPVRFQRPAFPAMVDVERYFGAAREIGWYSNGGPCFNLLADRLGRRTSCTCVPVSSGTSGLMIAAAALAPSPERPEVLMPSFTFAATAQAMIWNGLRPVFVDVDAEHLHLSPAALDSALEARADHVGLVVACSSFGTPPPPEVREAWERRCADAGVPLMVDSAAGFGALAADGLPIGGQGDVEVVSFHVTKPFGIGEGGAVFTRDRPLADRVRRLVNFGFDDRRRAVSQWGLNAKLDELHAAVGLAVLDTFDEQLDQRRSAAKQLLDAVGPAFRPQYGHGYGTYQLLPVVTAGEEVRNRVLSVAQTRVELRTYYEPLHLMPAFEDLSRSDGLPITESLGRTILSLPMGVDLTEEDIGRIADVCRQGSG